MSMYVRRTMFIVLNVMLLLIILTCNLWRSSTVLSQRGRVFSNSFPDLPDISAIKLDPFGKGDSSGNNSGGPVPSPCDIISEEQEEVSFISFITVKYIIELH